MIKYEVLVINYETDEVVRQYAGLSDRKAEKLEAGIKINLDTSKYYTAIRKAEYPTIIFYRPMPQTDGVEQG